MAEFKTRGAITFNVTIVLGEEEARALEAVLGYDINEFLEVFYEKMGKAYLQPHEKGLKTLGDSVRKDLRNQLMAINVARDAVKKAGV